jgi:hypothetical protein
MEEGKGLLPGPVEPLTPALSRREREEILELVRSIGADR